MAAAAPCTSASSPLIEICTGTNLYKANPLTQHLKGYMDNKILLSLSDSLTWRL